METQEVVGAGQAVGLRALSVFSSREHQIGSRMASSVEATSAVERSGPEPQPENGHLPETLALPSRRWNTQPEGRPASRGTGDTAPGPSVLESKVRALEGEDDSGQTGGRPRASLPTSGRPSRNPRPDELKVGGTKPPSGGAFRAPEAVVVHHAEPE